MTGLSEQDVKIVQREVQEHQGMVFLQGAEDWHGMQMEIVESPSLGTLKSGPGTACGWPCLKMKVDEVDEDPSSHICHHQTQT